MVMCEKDLGEIAQENDFCLNSANWRTLTAHEDSPSLPVAKECQLTFNPMNWRQLCLLKHNSVTAITVESCGDTHIMNLM